MKDYNVMVHIFRQATVQKTILNPEERVVLNKLRELAFTTVSGIRMGKCFVVSLRASDEDEAHSKVTEMCKLLLINPVTEEFEIVSIQIPSESA